MDPTSPASVPSPDLGDGFDDDLEQLLRPRPHPWSLDAVRAALRRLDRRVLVIGAVVAVIAVVVVIVVAGSAAPDPAAVTLPRAGAAAEPGADGAAGTPGAPAGAPTSAPVAEGSTSTTASASAIVHVAGAVARPGLVTLAAGARTADAIAAAGGPTPAADLDRVNLAAPVADGTRIYVPAMGQVDVPAAVGATATPGAGGGAGGTDPATPPAPVDLNTATADDLDALPGVGPATAAAILSYREEHGPFASVDALDDVRGIGPAKLDQLRDLVTVG